jgi:transcriptional regulator with XRE-family HTH domain
MHRMSTAESSSPVGSLIREWRQRRRLSQLDLALEADVSARHLSFVETGRSRPSPQLLLNLAEHLEVPLRERNSLLLAAGYAPLFSKTPLTADEMEPVRTALAQVLESHDPYPAVVVDRHWNLVSANRAVLAIFTEGVAPHLLEPPANALRVTLHPEGMAPRIENLAEYSGHLVGRLRREAATSGDPELHRLAAELEGYPGVSHEHADNGVAGRLFVPLALRADRGRTLRFFSTVATFGTALDITIAELAIESFFPADPETAETLRAVIPAGSATTPGP